MPTLAQVQQQINRIPHRYIFWTQKEIKYLPEIMNDDEEIRAITSGFMDNATWLAVCTTKRMIFLNRGMVFGMRQVQLSLDRIQTVDHSSLIMFGSIRVWDGANAFVLKMVLKPSIAPFVKATNQAISDFRKFWRKGGMSSGSSDSDQQQQPQLRTAPQPNKPAMADDGDHLAKLERLADLYERGVLSTEEFAAAKKKLLG